MIWHKLSARAIQKDVLDKIKKRGKIWRLENDLQQNIVFFNSDSAYINFTSLIHLTTIFERVNKRSKSSSENWPNKDSFAVIENRLAVSVIRRLQTADLG